MKLKSLRCPNCGGPVKKIGEKNYVCESCGTSFVPDLDPEDIEMERIKAEAEIKKKRLDVMQNGINQINNMQRTRRKAAPQSIAVVVISFIVVIIMISSISAIYSVFQYGMRKYRTASYEDEYNAKRSEMEEKAKKLQEEAQQAQEEAARRIQEALKKPTYVTDPDEIFADEVFTKNAKAALRAAAKDTDFLVWTNYHIDGEPKIMASYLLVAKDENARPQNRLISIYWINWYAEYGVDEDDDDEYHRDYFPIYQAQELSDLTINSDGTIKSDYAPDNASWHTEIPRNQVFWGYADYDQLIRECILAQSDYTAIEIDFSDGLGEDADPDVSADGGEDNADGGEDNADETE